MGGPAVVAGAVDGDYSPIIRGRLRAMRRSRAALVVAAAAVSATLTVACSRPLPATVRRAGSTKLVRIEPGERIADDFSCTPPLVPTGPRCASSPIATI